MSYSCGACGVRGHTLPRCPDHLKVARVMCLRLFNGIRPDAWDPPVAEAFETVRAIADTARAHCGEGAVLLASENLDEILKVWPRAGGDGNPLAPGWHRLVVRAMRRLRLELQKGVAA